MHCALMISLHFYLTVQGDVPSYSSQEGFTTAEALSHLHKDLSDVVTMYDKPHSTLLSTCASALKYSVSSIFPWLALLVVAACTEIIFIAVGLSDDKW